MYQSHLVGWVARGCAQRQSRIESVGGGNLPNHPPEPIDAAISSDSEAPGSVLDSGSNTDAVDAARDAGAVSGCDFTRELSIEKSYVAQEGIFDSLGGALLDVEAWIKNIGPADNANSPGIEISADSPDWVPWAGDGGAPTGIVPSILVGANAELGVWGIVRPSGYCVPIHFTIKVRSFGLADDCPGAAQQLTYTAGGLDCPVCATAHPGTPCEVEGLVCSDGTHCASGMWGAPAIEVQ